MGTIDIYDDLEAIYEQGTDLVKLYRQDPVTAAYDLLRVDLAPVQRLVLRDMWFKNYCITVAGRGAGKTYLLGVNAVLHALLYPGYRVGLIAPSFRQCFFNDIECLPIFTDRGMISSPIEFYNSIDSKTSIQSLKSTNGIINKWINDKNKGLIIKTTKGFEIGGLYKHRILILDDNLDLIYKELKDITKEDNIVIKKGFNLFGNDDSLPEYSIQKDWRTKSCRIPEELTPDISYWMGLLVGDGCVSIDKSERKQRINFVSQDSYLLERFRRVLVDYFIDDPESIELHKKEDNESFTMSYFGKNLTQFLLKCGFTKTTALDKKTPYIINKSSKENIAAFLSGLYDTDGGVNIQEKKYTGCTVDLSTSSLKLAKEVQAWLLNFGIMSSLGLDKESCKRKLNGRDKESVCAASYKVRITNYTDILKFKENINFKLERKRYLLNYYLSTVNVDKIKNSQVIPGSAKCIGRLVEDFDGLFRYGDTRQNNLLRYFKSKFRVSKNFTEHKIRQLLHLAEEYNICSESYYKIKDLLDMDLSYVSPMSFEEHEARTIDIEVDNENCYFAGGFINHNSKMIFAEVEKLYNKSPILRQATEKKPTRGADTCFLAFKAAENANGSYIEALPIGVDGAKIRGSRFYLIEIDELAQMPADVIDLVIRPMAAVHSEPMQKVREIERIEKLIKLGLATEDDLEDNAANKMIMASSGYYKFNHMWNRMKAYWQEINKGKTQYAVHQVPYQMMPRGFLDMNNIEEAKRTMSSVEFSMEYEAAMTSDSEGFFKASLLEACTRDSGFSVQLQGYADKEYILGVDPNQGGSALYGLVVIELGNPSKIVYVRGLKKLTTQEMTERIQRIVNNFNIRRIYMDAGGGGNAIKDLLAEGYNNEVSILDMDIESNKFKAGKKILKMINFSPSWISDANFGTLSLFENNRLRFPELPRSSDESEEKMYEDVRLLKSQMLSIVVTETARGVRHFDTPKKGQNKDLYSAILLAAYGVKELAQGEEKEPVLQASGLVRPHQQGAQFTSKGKPSSGRTGMSAAVLQPPV